MLHAVFIALQLQCGCVLHEFDALKLSWWWWWWRWWWWRWWWWRRRRRRRRRWWWWGGGRGGWWVYHVRVSLRWCVYYVAQVHLRRWSVSRVVSVVLLHRANLQHPASCPRQSRCHGNHRHRRLRSLDISSTGANLALRGDCSICFCYFHLCCSCVL